MNSPAEQGWGEKVETNHSIMEHVTIALKGNENKGNNFVTLTQCDLTMYKSKQYDIDPLCRTPTQRAEIEGRSSELD